MYKKILVPVDLAHLERLEKALQSAADLARHYGAGLCYVGVTANTPGPVAHNPQEFAAKLEAFARSQGEAHGCPVSTRAYGSHDPAVDLADKILEAVEAEGADLVVMASHVPGLPDHLFASNAGKLATHAAISVFVIR